MSLIIDEHREYLFDMPRIEAFRRALALTVRPGDVVLDLGSGTGILGFLACQAGAARVYAVDDGSIVELARALAVANGLADRVQVIRAVSTWASPPERVDVVVTDQIGRLGFNAGLVEYMADARARWMKPGGRMVPGAVTLHAAPWEHDGVREVVDCWSRPVGGLDVSLARSLAVSTAYQFTLDSTGALAPAASVVRFDLATAGSDMTEGAAEFAVARDGALDAVAGWFVADLAPGVTMTNDPASAARIQRSQALLPLDRRTPVRRGDRVHVTLRVRPTDSIIDWQVEVRDPDGTARASFRHSTFNGMLISTEDLRCTGLARVPALSPVGRVRRTTLELCDGERSVAEIEAGVYARHQDLLPTRAAAAAFVADVITRYAE